MKAIRVNDFIINYGDKIEIDYIGLKKNWKSPNIQIYDRLLTKEDVESLRKENGGDCEFDNNLGLKIK